MRIGTFIATDGGFTGQLKTLTLDIELALVPAESSDSENAPDFRVIAGSDDEAREVGAGWKHVGEKAAVASAAPLQPARPSWTESQLFAARSDSNGGASGSFAAAAPPQPIQARNAPLYGLFAPVSGSGSQ
ncbi:MAG: DUF736 domain-containing protein [Novosphingobium sp.]